VNARTKTNAIAGYREALRELAPKVPLVRFVTLREQMEAALGSQRAITFLSTFFGAVALFLSALGLYGMLSSIVTQRAAEFGIRTALGASRATILRMILSETARLGVIGAALGAVGVFARVFLSHRRLSPARSPGFRASSREPHAPRVRSLLGLASAARPDCRQNELYGQQHRTRLAGRAKIGKVTARLLNRAGQIMRALQADAGVEGPTQFALLLTSLAPGQYEIEVTGENRHGVVSDRITLRVE
jgi:hypothetical protein